MDGWLSLNQELTRLIEELDTCYDDEQYRAINERIDAIRAEIKALD